MCIIRLCRDVYIGKVYIRGLCNVFRATMCIFANDKSYYICDTVKMAYISNKPPLVGKRDGWTAHVTILFMHNSHVV